MGYLELIRKTLLKIVENEEEAKVYYKLIKAALEKKLVINKRGSICKNREAALNYFCIVLKQFDPEVLPKIDFELLSESSFDFDNMPKEIQENILTFVSKFVFAPVKNSRSHYQSLFSAMFFLDNPEAHEMDPGAVLPQCFRGIPFDSDWAEFSNGLSPFAMAGSIAHEFLVYLLKEQENFIPEDGLIFKGGG